MLLLPLIIPMEQALATVPIVLVVASIVTVLGDLRSLRLRPPLMVYVESIPGLLLATFLLRWIPSKVMILAASSLILLHCLNSVLPRKVHIPRLLEIPLLMFSAFIGVISGVWATYVPIMTEKIENPKIYRVSLNFLWLCFGLSLIPIYISNGYVTPDVLMSAFWSIPFVAVASFLGRKIAVRIKPDLFRKMILHFLMIIAGFRIITVIPGMVSG